jgi:hypothetical protein
LQVLTTNRIPQKFGHPKTDFPSDEINTVVHKCADYFTSLMEGKSLLQLASKLGPGYQIFMVPHVLICIQLGGWRANTFAMPSGSYNTG